MHGGVAVGFATDDEALVFEARVSQIIATEAARICSRCGHTDGQHRIGRCADGCECVVFAHGRMA